MARYTLPASRRTRCFGVPVTTIFLRCTCAGTLLALVLGCSGRSPFDSDSQGRETGHAEHPASAPGTDTAYPTDTGPIGPVRFDGAIDLSDVAVKLTPTPEALLPENTGLESVGQGAFGRADLDADGHADLLVGAPDREMGILSFSGPLTADVETTADHLALMGDEGGPRRRVVQRGPRWGWVPRPGGERVLRRGRDQLSLRPRGPGQWHHRHGGLSEDTTPGDTLARFRGDETTVGTYFRHNAALVGDLDGDGSSELVVTAQEDSTGLGGRGAAYVCFGPFTGDHAGRCWGGDVRRGA